MNLVKFLLDFIYRWFDFIFLIFFFGTYLFLTIFKGSKAIRWFLFLCILWASSEIWIGIIPGQEYLFSDSSGSFPGSIIPLGGLIYGVPLTALTFITWLIKKRREKERSATHKLGTLIYIGLGILFFLICTYFVLFIFK